MKTFLKTILPLLLFVGVFSACSEPDVWSKVPSRVSQFVQQYWPGQDLSYVANEKDGVCKLTIQNGPSLEFDAAGSWTSIKGGGSPLPSMLIYDQLPDALYRYIEESEATNGVYALSRTASAYDVTLLNSKVSYNISSGQITYVTTPSN
ncbi:MAG: hypothetical protein HDS57_01700 [Barnesiella sp.]|nr:hypothetical protein [Barnesiella sp.]